MKSQILLAAFLLLGFATAQAQDEKAEPIPGQYIVVLKETAATPIIKNTATADRDSKESENKAAREQNLSVVQGVYTKKGIKESAIVNQFADVLVGFTAQLSDSQKAAIAKDPAVKGVYQDYLITLGQPEPGGAGAQGGEPGAQSSQVVSCAVQKAGGPGNGAGKVTWIWVLNSGIDLDHPDLNVQANAPYAKSFIAGQTIEDGNGHGTFCAGAAAAKNNTFGSVGVSAGAKVVPVKVLSNAGSGSLSSILSGLNHVAQYDIPNDVVLLAIGSQVGANCENNNIPIRDAIRNLGIAGTHVVIAAGSIAANAAQIFPGCINGTKIYTVGALNCDLTCANYSAWGKPPIDWTAVGTNVYSTHSNGGYVNWSGTAAASSIVAGIIHVRSGAPASAGNVTCGGKTYPIAKR